MTQYLSHKTLNVQKSYITCSYTLLIENSQKYVQKYEPVLRFLCGPIPITLRHLLSRCLILHVAINFIARNVTKKCKKKSNGCIVYTWFSNMENNFASIHCLIYGLRTPIEEIAFTAWLKIMIYWYGRSTCCLPHRPKFPVSLIYAGCP